jgi:glycosyltransferase involved in cell wall biosynthesis
MTTASSEHLGIGLDLTCLEVMPETGVERAARRLAETLPLVAPDMRFVVIIRAGKPAPRMPDRTQVVQAPPSLSRALWREIRLPAVIERERLDLLHSPVAAVSSLARVPRVVTIHDVPARGTEGGGLLSPNRLRLHHALAVAAAVITPSEATREALLAINPAWDDRIRVIPHGVDDDFRPVGPPFNRERYGVPPGPYLLTVGTLRQRKDPETSIRALSHLVQQGRDVRLLFAGKQQMDPSEIETIAKRANVHDRVVFLGYVPREDLPDLYRDAAAFVLPSRLEGFGLPLVEAMASGTPVVAASTSSIPEVVGDGGVLFAAGDHDQLARVVGEILDDPARRGELRARGLARARAFDWKATARRHVEVYREALGRAPRVSKAPL